MQSLRDTSLFLVADISNNGRTLVVGRDSLVLQDDEANKKQEIRQFEHLNQLSNNIQIPEFHKSSSSGASLPFKFGNWRVALWLLFNILFFASSSF